MELTVERLILWGFALVLGSVVLFNLDLMPEKRPTWTEGAAWRSCAVPDAEPNPAQRVRRCTETIDAGQRGMAEQTAPLPVATTEALALAFNNRGLARAARNEFDAAIRDYDEALKLRAEFAEAFFNRAIAHEHKGQFDLVIRDYTSAIRLRPDDANLLNNRGFTFANRGQYERALRDYDEAIRLKPDEPGARSNRCLAHALTGRPAQAVEDCTRSLATRPNHATTLATRGLAQLQLARLTEARADYDAANRLDPQSAWALYGRAMVREAQGDGPGATADFAEARKRAKNDVEWQNVELVLGQYRKR
ncbi:MAG: tetratricopeptide repeat protein [Alphaproteobacteria bacterium]|nr:tetratricopeptide repeat protein [Alphaproteobacteria bacterium]